VLTKAEAYGWRKLQFGHQGIGGSADAWETFTRNNEPAVLQRALDVLFATGGAP
jgi:hypothetical protein